MARRSCSLLFTPKTESLCPHKTPHAEVCSSLLRPVKTWKQARSPSGGERRRGAWPSRQGSTVLTRSELSGHEKTRRKPTRKQPVCAATPAASFRGWRNSGDEGKMEAGGVRGVGRRWSVSGTVMMGPRHCPSFQTHRVRSPGRDPAFTRGP